MANGERTSTVSNVVALCDDLIVNREGSTGRMPVVNLGAQMVGSGPVAEALATRATTSDVSALTERVTVAEDDLSVAEDEITSTKSRVTAVEGETSAQGARISALEDATAYAQVLKAAWADLAAVSGAADGQGGEVDDSDTGTHLDATATGYDGVEVPNAGRFSWNVTWSRWVRVGDTGLSSKASVKELHAVHENFYTKTATWKTLYFEYADGLYVDYASGAHPSDPAYSYGDIVVTPGEVLLVTASIVGASTALAVWYDASGTYLGYTEQAPASTPAVYTDYPVTVPAGAAKMSVCSSIERPVVKRGSVQSTAVVHDYIDIQPSEPITTGYYLPYTSGTPTASGSYSFMKFRVEEEKTYFVSAAVLGTSLAAVVWYDDGGDYIGYSDQQTNTLNVMDRHAVTSPAGAAFAGLCQQTSQNAGHPMKLESKGHALRINGLEARVAVLEGTIKRPAVYRPERLRRTNVALRKLAAGESLRFAIQLLGDSWLDTPDFFTGKLASALRTTYGDGGIGWISAAGLSGMLRSDDVSVARFGTWTLADEAAAGPDITSATTSDTANPARLSVQLTDGVAATGARLFYRGSAGLQISYSWNLGAETTIPLETSGIHTLDIPGSGFGAGTGRRLDIRLVAGTLEAFGVDVLSDADGVIVHKCANNGSAASDWIAQDAAEWQTGVADLGAGLVMICLGTNDRSPDTPAVTFSANVQEIIDRVRAALPASGGVPYADILLVAPHNVPRTAAPVRDMAEYQAALYDLADENDCALADLYEIIGGNPYDKLEHFDAAGYHPSEDVGGWAVMDILGKFFGGI